MRVVTDLLGEWGSGKLSPRRFVHMWLLAFLALIISPLLLFTIVEVITWNARNMIDGNSWLWMLMVVSLLVPVAALANITFKRGRDIGFSGTMTGLGFLLLLVLGGAPALLTIFLGLVPSNLVGSDARESR